MKKFDVAYAALPPKLRRIVRDRITNDAFMVKNQQTFYNKKNGKEKITEYEWNRITTVFADFNIDAVTGKILEECQTH